MLVERLCPNSISCVLSSPRLCRLARFDASQYSSQTSIQFDEILYVKAIEKSFTDLLRVARVGNMNLGEDSLSGLLASLGFSLPQRLDEQSAFTGTVLVHLLSV